MKEFEEIYLNILLNENANNIFAQEYKNVWIEISNKTEINHFNKRIKKKDRNNNNYSFELILSLIKKGIDKFLTDSQFKQYRNDKINATNFSIISKTYSDIKIKILIWYNSKERRANAIQNGLPPVLYMCRLKTLLNKDMIDYSYDIPILVENIDKKEIIIYID